MLCGLPKPVNLSVVSGFQFALPGLLTRAMTYGPLPRGLPTFYTAEVQLYVEWRLASSLLPASNFNVTTLATKVSLAGVTGV